jgi:ABC-type histidine transport system ATPase subunit
MGQARRLATHTVFMLDGQVHESGGADMLNGAAQTPQLTAFLQGDIVT